MKIALARKAINNVGKAKPSVAFAVSILFLLGGFFRCVPAFAQKDTSREQQAIDAIKVINYNTEKDYITSGQRVLWVKSYKKWTPDDMAVIKKESPYMLAFFGRAIRHQRYDILEQLLPDYYREHGGVKTFSDDIMRWVDDDTKSSTKEKDN